MYHQNAKATDYQGLSEVGGEFERSMKIYSFLPPNKSPIKQNSTDNQCY